MRKQVAILAGLVVIALALAIVFLIAKTTFASDLFSFVWSYLRPGKGSPLALILFASTTPILVAIPFGCGFGLLPWRRPLVIALLTAGLAACLNLALSVWASISTGHSFLDSRSWVEFLEAALLVILFAGAAAFGTRAASSWPERQRLAIGIAVLASLTALTFAGAYLWYHSILEPARAA